MRAAPGVILLWALFAGAAGAQDALPGVPDLPAGPASVLGVVVHPDGPRVSANLSVTLFSLSREGRPGARETRTDGAGAFEFEGISNRPGIVYLLRVQYAEIPFGRRIILSPGQQELRVSVPISDPTPDNAELKVAETEIRFDWLGSRLEVNTTHLIVNDGDRVVYIERSGREVDRAPFAAELPEGATDFAPALGMHGDGLERQGTKLLHWGPFFSGQNKVEYRYVQTLSVAEEGAVVRVRGVLPSGTARLVVLAPEGDESLRVAGLERGEPAQRGANRYDTWVAEGLDRGAAFELAARVPASSHDPSALGPLRAEAWLELDDAALVVSQELRAVVQGDRQLVGSAEAPLLRFEIPEGAELLGLTQSARALGVEASRGGHVEVLGPLPVGESHFGFRYRLAVRGKTVPVSLRFPAKLSTLQVLVADTGVRVEDERLHRLRPVRSGTRMYLRREGFNIAADEAIELRITPLSTGAAPRWAAVSAVLLIAIGSTLFLFRPLGRRVDPEAQPGEVESASIRERETVYDAIRDLEHDFETGKISEHDQRRMQNELRARAVELLREEREVSRRARSAEATAASGQGMPPLRTGAFCPGCGERVAESWRFCSHCGATLATKGTG